MAVIELVLEPVVSKRKPVTPKAAAAASTATPAASVAPSDESVVTDAEASVDEAAGGADEPSEVETTEVESIEVESTDAVETSEPTPAEDETPASTEVEADAEKVCGARLQVVHSREARPPHQEMSGLLALTHCPRSRCHFPSLSGRNRDGKWHLDPEKDVAMTDMTPLSTRIPVGERRPLPDAIDGVSWRAATAADVDAILGLHAAADPIDHPTFGTPRGDIVELFESSWIDPTLDVVVGAWGDQIVAYGQATAHPGHRRLRGDDSVGRRAPRPPRSWHRQCTARLAAGACSRASRAHRRARRRPDERVHVDRAAGLHRLLEQRGFGVVRTFDELSRDIADDIPEIAIPEGLELVPYSQQWSAATLAAKNETFADHWGSLPETVEHWEQRNTSAANGAGGLRTDASLLLVRRDHSGSGEVVAFVLTTVNEEDWQRLGHPFGYITLVGVRRSQRGRGAAQALLAAVLTRHRELGWQRATLHVDTTSPTGADRLYRRIGFIPAARELVFGRTF